MSVSTSLLVAAISVAQNATTSAWSIAHYATLALVPSMFDLGDREQNFRQHPQAMAIAFRRGRLALIVTFRFVSDITTVKGADLLEEMVQEHSLTGHGSTHTTGASVVVDGGFSTTLRTDRSKARHLRTRRLLQIPNWSPQRLVGSLTSRTRRW